MNNEMQNLKKFLSFVQKTQKYVIFLLIFPFISSGEQAKLNELRTQESPFTFSKIARSLEQRNTTLAKKGVIEEAAFFNVGISFYEINEFKPVWSSGFVPNQYATILKQIIENAESYGLFPKDFLLDEVKSVEERLSNENDAESLFQLRTDYEIMMSGMAVKFISQLHYGMFRTDSMLSNGNTYEAFKHCYYHLYESLKSNDFKNSLLDAQPQSLHYRQLQKAVENWLARVSLSGDSIKFTDDNLLSISEALLAHGYKCHSVKSDSLEVTEVLKRFQKHKGLVVSGKLTDDTKKALQLSTFDYFLKIAINMERMKADTWTSNKKYVFVNIPSFKVKVYEDGNTERTFKAVVGKPNTPTPEITSKIEQIVTCPKWYVPRSIATRELLYHMKRDSQYLEKKNFSLLDKQHNELNYNDLDWDNLNAVNFNYKVMQRPGRLNALGTLKFLFPNDYSVYLHDTPAKQYFNKEIRAYSHGCVRLEKPAEFADYIIREMDELEDIESVNGLIKNGTTYKINLKQPVRIAIRYYTCEADADNNLLFLSDIYNKDKPMIEQILN